MAGHNFIRWASFYCSWRCRYSKSCCWLSLGELSCPPTPAPLPTDVNSSVAENFQQFLEIRKPSLPPLYKKQTLWLYTDLTATAHTFTSPNTCQVPAPLKTDTVQATRFWVPQPAYKINIAIEGRTCLHHLDKEYLCLFIGKSLLRSEMGYWLYISCPVGWIRRIRIRSSWASDLLFEGGNFKWMWLSKRMKHDWVRHPPSGQSEGLPDRNCVALWRVRFKPNWWM